MDGWDDKMDLMVVLLNDFDMILSNDFFVTTKIAILPHLFGLLIGNEEKSCFVTGHSIPIDVEVCECKVEMVFTM